jgi:hypothetical protein
VSTAFVTVSSNEAALPVHVNQFAAALAGTGDYIIVLAAANNSSPTLLVTNSGTGGGIVADTFRLTASGLIIPQISTPAVPGAGKTIVYAKSDGLLYLRSGAAGAETPILSVANGAALALMRMNAGGTAPEFGSAGQIDFPAAQNPSSGANTLDDYEEGTWLPTNGSTAFVLQTGKYTKIGRHMNISMQLGVSTFGAGSAVTISGLPVTPSMNTALAVGYFDNSVTNIVSLMAFANASSAAINLWSMTAAGATPGNNSIMQFGTNIWISGGYPV